MKKTEISVDVAFLGNFRHWVAEYNRLLDLEGTTECEIYEDFYIDLLDAIGQIHYWFEELKDSKEIAKTEFNVEEIPGEFINRIRNLAQNGAKSPQMSFA